MKVQSTVGRVGFNRCAVCKIDLKGRFVYLDEETEKLLGCSSEELFGKSFLDFIDENSTAVIEALLAQRNHYEVFFDSTRITLAPATGNNVTVEVVASLNFNGGNPVNFQLIFIEAKAPLVSSQPGKTYDTAFIDAVAKTEEAFNWKSSLPLLRDYCNCTGIALYCITGDQLQPRAGVSELKTTEFNFQDIPKPGELHQSVASSGKEYDFTDQKSVARAVEQGGAAPNELITRVTFSPEDQYLVTFSFSGSIKPAKAVEAIKRARLGLSLVSKLIKLSEAQATVDQEMCDVKFTIGFLESLGIGAALVHSDGLMSGYNSAILDMLNVTKLEGNYIDLAAALTAGNTGEIQTEIESFFNQQVDEENYQDFARDLILPNGLMGRLIIMRFSHEASDRSAAFVFIPANAGHAHAEHSSTAGDSNWSEVGKDLKTRLNQLSKIADKFGHENYNILNDQANKQLENIIDQARSVEHRCEELTNIVSAIDGDPNQELVDLDLLLKQVITNLKKEHESLEVTCHTDKLPKVMTDKDGAEKVLSSIIAGSHDSSTSKTTAVKIEGTIIDNSCQLIITESSPDRSKTDSISSAGNSGEVDAKMILSQQLAQSLGWQLVFESGKKRRSSSISIDLTG